MIATFGMLILVADLFCTFSRTLEFFPIKAGPVSLAVTLRIMVLVCGILSGGIFVLMESKIAKSLLFFSGWMILGIPFSSWKGGSVDLLLHFWLPVVFAFIGGTALIHSVAAARKMVYAIAFSSLAILVFSSIFSTQDANSRLEVGTGSLGNANDLATLLLLGLPCMLLYMQENKGVRRIVGFIMLLSIPFVLKVVSATASRSGLITILVFAFMLFLSGSGVHRIALTVLVLVGGTLFFITAPASTLSRYRTILPFLPQTNAQEAFDMLEESALESSEARRQLLMHSLELTVQHPIFGVGVGTFVSAAAQDSAANNQHASWHETHNSFTQISSECGIPALIAYLAAVVCCFRSLLWVKRRSRNNTEFLPLLRLSNCLLAVMVSFTISACFSSMAYLPMFPFLAAIVDGFQRHAKKQIQSREPVLSQIPGFPAMAMRPRALAR